MRFLTIPFSVLLGIGCSQAPELLDPAAVSRNLMSECRLSCHEVLDNGKLTPWPFIGSQHVASLGVAQKPFPDAEPAIFVTLTAEGEKRMLNYTKNHIGHSIAAFCGDAEVYRAVISEPFGNHFNVSFPLDQPDGT